MPLAGPVGPGRIDRPEAASTGSYRRFVEVDLGTMPPNTKPTYGAVLLNVSAGTSQVHYLLGQRLRSLITARRLGS
jgi:hypothetical protein